MTTTQPFPENPSYIAVVRGLLRMHELRAQGQFESPEADALRDAMDSPWEGLSETERTRLRGLSEDLNALSEIALDNPSPAMSADTQERINQVHETRQRGDWDTALELLRRSETYIPPALASYLRGTIWGAAGDAATAAVFFEHASHVEPTNQVFQTVKL